MDIDILNNSDIFKSLPESVQKGYKEMYGLAETGTSIVTGIGAPALGIAETAYDTITYSDSPNLKKAEEWLETNKDLVGDPRYSKVEKWMQSEIAKRPNEATLDENVNSYTYAPKSEEGQRNVQAIGETLDKYKIPPFIPGVGNTGRFGVKRKPKARKVKKDDIKSLDSSEGLFSRARTYFDEAEEARVDFKPSAIKNTISDMKKSLRDNNISDLSTYGKNAYNQLKRMELEVARGKPISFNKIMEFRDLIDDIETINKPKSRRVASILRDDLDTFISDAGESVMHSGSQGTKLNLDAFKKGQQYYSKAKNTQMLEEALQNAQMTKSGNYSQAQLVDAMKKEVKKIIKSKKKFKFFKAPQKEVLRKFAEGGKFEEFLKQASKFDPLSGGWMLSPTTLATLSMGGLYGGSAGATALGIGTVVGQGAKRARSAALKNSIDKMMANIQNRKVDVNTGFSQVNLPTDLGLLGTSVAGQNAQDEEIQSLLQQQKLPFPQGR
jgi:hypothetical protein